MRSDRSEVLQYAAVHSEQGILTRCDIRPRSVHAFELIRVSYHKGTNVYDLMKEIE